MNQGETSIHLGTGSRLREFPFALDGHEPPRLESVVTEGEPARHARGTDD